MKRARVGMLAMLIACVAALCLNGCSAAAHPRAATTTAGTPSPVASVAPCLVSEQHVRAATVDGIGVFTFADPTHLRHVREFYDASFFARMFAGTAA